MRWTSQLLAIMTWLLFLGGTFGFGGGLWYLFAATTTLIRSHV